MLVPLSALELAPNLPPRNLLDTFQTLIFNL